MRRGRGRRSRRCRLRASGDAAADSRDVGENFVECLDPVVAFEHHGVGTESGERAAQQVERAVGHRVVMAVDEHVARAEPAIEPVGAAKASGKLLQPVADAILAHCRERIGGYKLPRSVELVDTLPRTPSGKVLKRELRP